MEHIDFYLGEQRYLDFEVRSTKNEHFNIVDADYTVTRKDGSVLDKGSATVTNGNLVKFLFNAKEKGVFVVALDVIIPPEKIEHKSFILVK